MARRSEAVSPNPVKNKKAASMCCDGPIDDRSIYRCTGAPHPSEIQKIIRLALTKEYSDAYVGERPSPFRAPIFSPSPPSSSSSLTRLVLFSFFTLPICRASAVVKKKAIAQIKGANGLAMADLIREIHALVEYAALPREVSAFIIDALSELE